MPAATADRVVEQYRKSAIAMQDASLAPRKSWWETESDRSFVELEQRAALLAIANVELDVAGQRVVASITLEAVDELGITEGADVTAIIKASDVMIATNTA
jgi:molybdopterin-binding protein